MRERLRLVRASLGESQKGMAKLLNLGVNGWQQLERDGRAPKGDALAYLVERGISADWLLTGEGRMERDDPDIDRCLREILSVLSETESSISARPLDRPDLAAILDALRGLLARKNLVAGLQKGAEGQQPLGFGGGPAWPINNGVAGHHEKKDISAESALAENAASRLKATTQLLDAALGAVSWAPSQLMRHALLSLVFSYPIGLDDLVPLLSVIKSEIDCGCEGSPGRPGQTIRP